MQALILAGGFGTRLRPLTLNKPKPVVSLIDRPILAYQLMLLRKAGITDVILSLNYQPTKIQEIIGDGAEYGVNVRYVVEPEPLGTAGAVKFAEKYISETLVILNGDNLINLDIGEVVKRHKKTEAAATIVLQTVENPVNYGLVEIDERQRILNFLEKPKAEDLTNIKTRTVNAGTYIFEPEILDLIPPNVNYSFEYAVFPELLKRGAPFFAFLDASYWLDLGTPDRYLQAHADLINGRVAGFEIKDDRRQSKIASTAEVSRNSFIGRNCVIGESAIIDETVCAANVEIGANSSVVKSVVGRGTRIGENARIFGAIISDNCVIGNYAAVGAETVLGDGSVLTDYGRV